MSELLAYYVLLECGHCDAEIHYGPCASLLSHRGLLVVPADQACQTRFDCDECGAENYVGDLDVEVEGGRDATDQEDGS